MTSQSKLFPFATSFVEIYRISDINYTGCFRLCGSKVRGKRRRKTCISVQQIRLGFRVAASFALFLRNISLSGKWHFRNRSLYIIQIPSSYGNTLSKSIRKTRVSRFAISVNNSFSRRHYHKFGIILLHRTCESFTRELDRRCFTVRYRCDMYVCFCFFLIGKERKKDGRLCARSLTLTAPFITRRLHDTQTT